MPVRACVRAWSVERGAWSVKWGAWTLEFGVRSVRMFCACGARAFGVRVRARACMRARRASAAVQAVFNGCCIGRWPAPPTAAPQQAVFNDCFCLDMATLEVAALQGMQGTPPSVRSWHAISPRGFFFCPFAIGLPARGGGGCTACQLHARLEGLARGWAVVQHQHPRLAVGSCAYNVLCLRPPPPRARTGTLR